MQGLSNSPTARLEIGVLVAAARRRIKQVVWAKLAPYDLTPQQFWVLLHLHDGTCMSLHELAERIWADDPTACRIVARLTERGLVKADNDPKDRRRFRLGLTAAGRKLAGELLRVAERIRVGIEHGLSSTQKGDLCRLLQRVVDNMDRMSLADAPEHSPVRQKRARS
jgi:DNA-binding MarR family transcriptional regulator